LRPALERPAPLDRGRARMHYDRPAPLVDWNRGRQLDPIGCVPRGAAGSDQSAPAVTFMLAGMPSWPRYGWSRAGVRDRSMRQKPHERGVAFGSAAVQVHSDVRVLVDIDRLVQPDGVDNGIHELIPT